MMAIVQGTKKSNLAFKAKKMVVRAPREEVEEERCVEDDEDTSCPTDDFEEYLALLVKK
jgi:hypothetical protein